MDFGNLAYPDLKNAFNFKIIKLKSKELWIKDWNDHIIQRVNRARTLNLLSAKHRLVIVCVWLFLGLHFLGNEAFAQPPVVYDIKGVTQDKLRSNIRLYLQSLDVEKGLLREPYWQDEVGAAVASAVEPFGYYNSETRVSFEEKDAVTVTVTLNAPLIINKVTREIIGAGREDSAFRARFNGLKLKEGDVLDQLSPSLPHAARSLGLD